MVSVTVMIKEEPTTSAVAVDDSRSQDRSQERLADADELEAVLVHVTRPSAQIYLRSLITNLRKEGKALQRVAASTSAASSSAATAGSDDSSAAPSPAPSATINLRKEGKAVQSTSEDSASPTVQSTITAVGSPTPLPATDRVATPQEISPVNEPTIANLPITRCTITPANKDQVFPAQYESKDDKINRYIYQYNQRAKKEMAKAIAAEREQRSFLADLNDVPPQPPIPKEGHIKDGASKYTGVYRDKYRNKWVARITIDGKQRRIGYYDNEEEAATIYARAAFKYRSEKKAETEKTQNSAPETKRKLPPCVEDENKADAPKRLKNAEKDNCNHMQAIKLEEDCYL